MAWDDQAIAPIVAMASREQGRLLGRMEALGFDLRRQAQLTTLTEDVLWSSEIEGENLNSDQVRSSIARRLGMDIGGLVRADRDVEGIVEMMLVATTHYEKPLTADRLFDWHAALFPTARSGMHKITVGSWRTDRSGPMQVVSGPVGKQKVRFEAPPAARVPREMERFLAWFGSPGKSDPLLVAGLAHFWFVTLHPFEDGNGRIARAIADMALARSEGSGQRFYSMSAQIRREREDYYAMLERCQKATLDVTAWQAWFLGCLRGAIEASDERLAPSSTNRSSGSASRSSRSTHGRSKCSIGCSTALRGSSLLRSGRSSRSPPRIPPTATFST